MTTPMPPNPPFIQGTGDAPTGPATQQPPVPSPPAPQAPLAPPVEPLAPAQPPVRYFTEEDIARVRQEEKDKLYGRIQQAEQRAQTFEERLAAIEAERQQQAEAAAQAQAAEEAERRRKAEEEKSAKELITQRETEWEQRFAQLQAERDQERQMLAKEQQFAALQAYINRRAREEAENIAPELIDLITGNSEEEVERSIQMLRAKTDQIAASLTAAQQAQIAAQRGVSTAGYAAAGPMDDQPGQRTLTPDEIQNMPMSEWAKIRGQVIGASANQTSRGLYG